MKLLVAQSCLFKYINFIHFDFNFVTSYIFNFSFH